MNVCFLDVDGVLNSSYTTELSPEGYTGIDDKKVELLADIVNSMNMKIVLSSDWRKCFGKDSDARYLTEKLGKYGLEIDSFTSDIGSYFRGVEISVWLNQHKDTKQYVILDDNLFDFDKCGKLLDHVIQTNERTDNVFAANGLFDSIAASKTPTPEVEQVLKIISNVKNNVKSVETNVPIPAQTSERTDDE